MDALGPALVVFGAAWVAALVVATVLRIVWAVTDRTRAGGDQAPDRRPRASTVGPGPLTPSSSPRGPGPTAAATAGGGRAAPR